MAVGRQGWPRPWRGRKTSRTSPSSPISRSSEGAPNGLSTASSGRSQALDARRARSRRSRPAPSPPSPSPPIQAAGLIAERRRLGYRRRDARCQSRPCRRRLACAGAAHAGETRCWVDHGALVVPAAFGDIAGDFILDLSAAAEPAPCRRGAQAHGIVTPQARGDTAPGRRDASPASRMRGRRASTRAASGCRRPTSPALIGADALAGFVIDIRFDPCRVTLWRGAPAAVRCERRPCRSRWRTASRRSAPRSRMATAALAGLFAIDTARRRCGSQPGRRALARAGQGRRPCLAARSAGAVGALSAGGRRSSRRLPAALVDACRQASPAGSATAVVVALRGAIDAAPRPLSSSQRRSRRSVRDVAPDRAVAAVEQAGEDHAGRSSPQSPVCLRCSIFGSDAHCRKAATSLAS